MITGFGIGFMVIGIILLAFMLMALLRIGIARLESAVGIAGDGLPLGAKAPRWTGTDLIGEERAIPGTRTWQVLVFCDHSLASFPSLAMGLNDLAGTPEVDVILVSRDERPLSEATARVLSVAVPMLCCAASLYSAFRVRVQPFGFVVAPDGTIAWSGLVNTREQLHHVLRMARARTANLVPELAASSR
jgi:hypothetical protein